MSDCLTEGGCNGEGEGATVSLFSDNIFFFNKMSECVPESVLARVKELQQLIPGLPGIGKYGGKPYPSLKN
jgi:hypothetical protein